MAEPADGAGVPTARRRIGVQGRLTLAATALVAVGLAAGAAVLVTVLRHTLLTTLDDTARQRAQVVAALVDSSNLPRVVPAAGGTVLVQVVDGQGRVRGASPGGDALVPLLSGRALAAVRRGETRSLPGSRIGGSDRLRVVAVRAGAADRQTVLVAVSGTEAARSLRVVALVLGVGAPVLIGGFAVACWLLVGAALRPVAELRRGAESVTETGTSARLPVPPTRDEVARLARTLNDMLDRLAAGGARQQAFVADAAHELRSPLASIRTQLEVALAHPEGADWADTADDVLVDVGRLSRLVDDLLLLARLDDDHGAPRAAPPVDLRVLAETAVRRPGRTHPVELVADPDPVVATIDQDVVVRVLDNLVSNADRHAATRVVVTVRRDGGSATLAVTDDGPGIPAEARARVFERFTRLDASRAQGSGGSGLGLAIVRQLVQSHHGSIVLEDAAPGLRVVVRLPAASPAA
ncbi:MAG: ATP-binding protein [Sporichthyaceae bacterium]